MQRGMAAYAVTEENLLSPLRLGCHPHGITKSDTGGEFIKSMFCVGKDNVKSRYPRPSTNSPPVSKVAKNPNNN
jgi:hypothetical protein